MAVLEAQVGHMSTQMLRWYTHVSSRAQHEAAGRIEAENPELLTVLGLRAQEVVVMTKPVTAPGNSNVIDRAGECAIPCGSGPYRSDGKSFPKRQPG
jgi:hypothetical protein